MIFGGLKIYTAHIKPERSEPYETAVFVQEGFNLMSFIFGGLWALFNRLWWLAGAFLIMNLGMAAMIEFDIVSYSVTVMYQLAFQIWVAFNANDFLRHRLKKKGYIIDSIVTGPDKLAAEQRFFEHHARQLKLSPQS